MTHERLLNIQNGHNFRDLGGYETIDGRQTKWKRIIRAGSLANLSKEDLAELESIPVTVDIDLRSPEEVKQAPDRVPSTATYYHLPVLQSDETDASHSVDEIKNQILQPGSGHKHMVDIYKKMVLVDSAKAAYQKMFELLLRNGESDALLFHCTAGKDRTGLGAFFILNALQVPEKTIMEDYLLTNKATEKLRHQWIQALRDKNESEVIIENCIALASVSPDYLNAALETIKENYGNMNNYLHEHMELSDSDLKELRNKYLN